MRRLLLPALLVPVLLIMLAAPVAAAPPYRESGTQVYSSAFASSCGATTCTDTWVDAFTIDSQTLIVCFGEYTYNIRNGRLVSDRSGCTDTDPSTLTVANDFAASLAPTGVQVCGRRNCTTVGVAFDLSPVGGAVYTDSGRGSFSDGTCTYRYSFSGEWTEVAGTLWVDGSAHDAYGSAGRSEYTNSVRCR